MASCTDRLLIITDCPNAERYRRISAHESKMHFCAWQTWTTKELTIELRRENYAGVILDCPQKDQAARAAELTEALGLSIDLGRLRQVIYFRSYLSDDTKFLGWIMDKSVMRAVVSYVPEIRNVARRFFQLLVMGYNMDLGLLLKVQLDFYILEHAHKEGPIPPDIGFVQLGSMAEWSTVTCVNELAEPIEVLDHLNRLIVISPGESREKLVLMDGSYRHGTTLYRFIWDCNRKAFTTVPLQPKVPTKGGPIEEDLPAKTIAVPSAV